MTLSPLPYRLGVTVVMVVTVVMAISPHKEPGFPPLEYAILQALPWDVPRLPRPAGPSLGCYQAAPPSVVHTGPRSPTPRSFLPKPVLRELLSRRSHLPTVASLETSLSCHPFLPNPFWGIAKKMKPPSHSFFETDALGKLSTCHLLSRNP